MPSILGEAVGHIQNPALGSVLQWRFAAGYSTKSAAAEGCPLVLLFLVLPIVYHEATYRHLKSTNATSGLRVFVSKFGRASTQQGDLLYGLHDRTAAMRDISLDALQIATTSRLIAVDLDNARVHSAPLDVPSRGIPRSIQGMIKNSEKLGAWCADLTLYQVSATLKVRF